jgi:hypothetical protein
MKRLLVYSVQLLLAEAIFQGVLVLVADKALEVRVQKWVLRDVGLLGKAESIEMDA